MTHNNNDRDPEDIKRGTRLRKLREKRGLSARSFAKTVGVSEASVRHWETGRNAPASRHVYIVAQALGVKPEEFMGENWHELSIDEEEADRQLHDDFNRFIRTQFVRINATLRKLDERLTGLEGRAEDQQSLLEDVANQTKPLVTELRRRDATAQQQREETQHPPAERRATGGRRRSDPPLPPGR